MSVDGNEQGMSTLHPKYTTVISVLKRCTAMSGDIIRIYRELAFVHSLSALKEGVLL